MFYRSRSRFAISLSTSSAPRPTYNFQIDFFLSRQWKMKRKHAKANAKCWNGRESGGKRVCCVHACEMKTKWQRIKINFFSFHFTRRCGWAFAYVFIVFSGGRVNERRWFSPFLHLFLFSSFVPSCDETQWQHTFGVDFGFDKGSDGKVKVTKSFVMGSSTLVEKRMHILSETPSLDSDNVW